MSVVLAAAAQYFVHRQKRQDYGGFGNGGFGGGESYGWYNILGFIQ